jgi:ribosomal protein L19E
MKNYEKTIRKIQMNLFSEKKSEPIEKTVVRNLYDVIGLHFNKPKPYLGDYYASDETENKNCC